LVGLTGAWLASTIHTHETMHTHKLLLLYHPVDTILKVAKPLLEWLV